MKDSDFVLLDHQGLDSQLLAAVEKYYILDERIFTEELVDERAEIQKLVTEKTSNIMEHRVPEHHSNLIRSYQDIFGAEAVRDQAYQPFPNLVIRIDLGAAEAEGTKVVTTLKLVISLLTNMYTVFYEEMVTMSGIGLSPVFMMYILNSGFTKLDPHRDKLEKLKNEVLNHFLNYSEVSLDNLFNRTITYGHQWGQYPLANQPVYSYLFESGYFQGQYLLATYGNMETIALDKAFTQRKQS